MQKVVLIIAFILGTLQTSAQELAETLGQAYKAYAEQQFEHSIQLLTELENQQTSFDVYKLMGDAYHKIERFDEAISAYNKAERFNSANSELYVHRGAAKISSGQLNAALSDLNKALEIDSRNTKALYYRGTANYLLFKNKAAIKDYSLCLEIDPNYAAAWYMRGASRGELQQYKGAINDYAKAYDIDPSLEQALFNIAVLKYLNGDYDGAKSDFDQLLSSNLKNKNEVYYYRGECHHFTGNKQDACKDYLNAKELGDEEAAILYDKYCLKGMNRGKLPKRQTSVIAL
jgi:tetratricopeptide (TPR) repeat protein